MIKLAMSRKVSPVLILTVRRESGSDRIDTDQIILKGGQMKNIKIQRLPPFQILPILGRLIDQKWNISSDEIRSDGVTCTSTKDLSFFGLLVSEVLGTIRQICNLICKV
jgi:hypothetical protein